jgi:hypothetical protein
VEWQKLRKRALEDLFFFASVVLGYANRFPMETETHLLPLKFVERKTGIADLDEAPMQLILWPRETGKSTLATRAHAIQLACGNPNIAILIANEKQETAADFLSEIKEQFQSNDLLRALFPEVIPEDFNKTTWSATRATLKRTQGRPECTFETIGVGGTVTGKHFDIIICDDLISQEAAENARSGSWLVMEKVNRWVTRLRPLLSSGFQPFPWVRFIGTRWHHGDSYDSIRETFGHGEEPRRYNIRMKLPSGKYITREVERIGDLAYMKIAAIENGIAAFPKIHSLDKLGKMRLENPEEFACLMMNDPSGEEVRTFRDEWLRYWQMVDRDMAMYDDEAGKKKYVRFDNLHKVMLIDPAFTASAESARSALIVIGTDMDGKKHLILDATALQVEPADLVSEIVNKMQFWGVSRVFGESVAQQKGLWDFLKSTAQGRGLALDFQELKPGGRAKDLRIESLGPYIKSGQVLFNSMQLDLLDEYRKFRPGARFKDLLDALAYMPEAVPRLVTGAGVNARNRSSQQLQSYLSRRKLA